jgi:hypothetical protein
MAHSSEKNARAHGPAAARRILWLQLPQRIILPSKNKQAILIGSTSLLNQADESLLLEWRVRRLSPSVNRLSNNEASNHQENE